MADLFKPEEELMLCFTREELIDGLVLKKLKAIASKSEYIKNQLWKVTEVGFIKNSEDFIATEKACIDLIEAMLDIQKCWDQVKLLKSRLKKQ